MNKRCYKNYAWYNTNKSKAIYQNMHVSDTVKKHNFVSFFTYET